MDPHAARARRRRIRWARRLAGALVLVAPTAWILLSDLARRGRLILAFDAVHARQYRSEYAISLGLWAALVFVASRRRGLLEHVVAVVFLALFTIVVGVEGAFHAFYDVYLSMDRQLHSKSMPWSIVGTLPLSRPIIVFHIALAAVIGAAVLYAGRRLLKPGRVSARLVAILVPYMLFRATRVEASYRTEQSSPYDMIYFHGITALARERLGYTHESPDLRVQKRSPEEVPAMTPTPARPRNVILIVQESERFDVTCNAYDPKCDLATRFTNVEVPDRMPLNQMRANDSTTAISIANIWSGVAQIDGRERLHSVPLAWEYAHAAGLDAAYWTSQNLMFGNARLYVQDIPVSHRAVATNLDPESDLDRGCDDELVTDRANHDLDELKEPFFAVVHYSNIHYPYVYDEAYAPFQPAQMDKSAEKNEEFKNFYKDVVYLSDKKVAKLLHHIRASAWGPRTVVVFTSDHGEAFREHWQLGHTSAIYEEEIHVPAWIDAPEGTLSPEERASIASAKDEFVFHLDLAATLFDLMGIWDAPEMKPFRDRMPGHPITRRARSVGPVPLTNCTWVWECAFRNWGLMQGPMKLTAREWDGEYRCFDVIADPEEETNLGEQACGTLPDVARGMYRVMPNVIPPGRPKVDWAKK